MKNKFKKSSSRVFVNASERFDREDKGRHTPFIQTQESSKQKKDNKSVIVPNIKSNTKTDLPKKKETKTESVSTNDYVYIQDTDSQETIQEPLENTIHVNLDREVFRHNYHENIDALFQSKEPVFITKKEASICFDSEKEEVFRNSYYKNSDLHSPKKEPTFIKEKEASVYFDSQKEKAFRNSYYKNSNLHSPKKESAFITKEESYIFYDSQKKEAVNVGLSQEDSVKVKYDKMALKDIHSDAGGGADYSSKYNKSGKIISTVQLAKGKDRTDNDTFVTKVADFVDDVDKFKRTIELEENQATASYLIQKQSCFLSMGLRRQ